MRVVITHCSQLCGFCVGRRADYLFEICSHTATVSFCMAWTQLLYYCMLLISFDGEAYRDDPVDLTWFQGCITDFTAIRFQLLVRGSIIVHM